MTALRSAVAGRVQESSSSIGCTQAQATRNLAARTRLRAKTKGRQALWSM
jgi:hypothetical protein